MAEYIKKSDALGVLEHCAMWNRGLNAAYDEMQLVPAADVVEVVHGEWIKPYYNRYGHPCHVCSVCGFHASCLDKNYCASCGAKMVKE